MRVQSFMQNKFIFFYSDLWPAFRFGTDPQKFLSMAQTVSMIMLDFIPWISKVK